jgi:hypothetical protein
MVGEEEPGYLSIIILFQLIVDRRVVTVGTAREEKYIVVTTSEYILYGSMERSSF